MAQSAARCRVVGRTLHDVERLTVLRKLRLGADVAEHDQGLEKYFVPTASYLTVVADQADIIIGPKGSGKTAIFRYLTNDQVKIRALNDVDMIPAFNVKGAVLFRRMVETMPDDEELLRRVWLAYITAIVGNHILHTYASTFDVNELNDWLTRAGLSFSEEESEPIGILSKIMSRMGAETRSGTIQLRSPEIRYAPAVTASIDFEKKEESPPRLADVDYEQGLELASLSLAAIGRRCWVLFDRLDESFLQDEKFETSALRGLLRAYLDLVSLVDNIRTKVFLRSDALDRITRSRKFVNATHLRQHRLRWDGNEIVTLIANRLIKDRQFREYQGLDVSLKRSLGGRKHICLALIPGAIRDVSVWRWLFSNTMDLHDELSPRNCLTLLRYAKDRQVAYLLSGGEQHDTGHALIRYPALVQAAVDLSKSRLEDTVFAEHPDLRPYVESLRDIPARFTRLDLAAMLQMPEDSPEFTSVVASFEFAGVLRVLRTGDVLVPLIYRHALDSMGEVAGAILEQTSSGDRRIRRRGQRGRSHRQAKRDSAAVVKSSLKSSDSDGYLETISTVIAALVSDPSSRRVLQTTGMPLSLIRESIVSGSTVKRSEALDEEQFSAGVAVVVALQNSSSEGRLAVEHNNDSTKLFLHPM
jgi:hypothetical protein